ncbi:MAG: Cardiolipin synthase (EC phosphatidylethanolamine-utilizing, bacterial type ClsC [uncultured Paraburkholderia sp.]|nr:MAG: Cardiolipin synthase (EC phosphatidylethanolamine-utilizing, bacterial type ClsC [uncultured Paraburkholderia sp.]CAH2936076.1 MAG: Cardiolipin synthase (EC phosphatidylethanolamine-utilizing, bacterial type ClsC [uncultured Paraburkholderia sp.]
MISFAVGPAANDVAHDFDRYWSSDSAYPVDRILPRPDAARPTELDARAHALESEPAAIAYADAVRSLPIAQQLPAGTLPLEWAKTRLVSDDPAKALNKASGDALVLRQFHEILGDPRQELDLVSPYFVPTDSGVQYFTQLAASGVSVRVLTNALEATDVSAVHSGYAKRRVALLKGGVQLYELWRVASADSRGTNRTTNKDGAKTGSGGPFGSSGSSLHAKTLAVDSQRVFIGSFNFDPRSAHLNTELGLS